MKKEIIVSLISSALGALILFIAVSSLGLLEKKLSDSQIRDVAQTIVDNENYRDVIIDKMKEHLKFKADCESNWGEEEDRKDLVTELTCDDGEFLRGIKFTDEMHADWWTEKISLCCSEFK